MGNEDRTSRSFLCPQPVTFQWQGVECLDEECVMGGARGRRENDKGVNAEACGDVSKEPLLSCSDLVWFVGGGGRSGGEREVGLYFVFVHCPI